MNDELYWEIIDKWRIIPEIHNPEQKDLKMSIKEIMEIADYAYKKGINSSISHNTDYTKWERS